MLLLEYHYNNMCEGHQPEMDMCSQPVEGYIVFLCAAARPVTLTVITQINLN